MMKPTTVDHLAERLSRKTGTTWTVRRVRTYGLGWQYMLEGERGGEHYRFGSVLKIHEMKMLLAMWLDAIDFGLMPCRAQLVDLLERALSLLQTSLNNKEHSLLGEIQTALEHYYD
jgi:hypothetical protein